LKTEAAAAGEIEGVEKEAETARAMVRLAG